MISKYKHIIWDWNGTLFDDLHLSASLINGVLRKRNLPELSIEKYREIFTFPVKDYYARTGLDFEKESFEVVGKEWMDQYELRKYECGLSRCAIEVLEKIRNKGIDQSILSAYSQHTLVEVVTKSGVAGYFSHMVGLDNIYATSKLELGKKLINDLGLNGGEAVLIGDTLHDFDVAKGIGADCILIAGGHQCKETLLTSGVQVYDSLEDLSSAIDRNT